MSTVNALSSASPEALSHARPEALSHARPEALSHARPEALSHARPKALSHARPKALSHARPEALSHARPKALSHAQPEAVPAPLSQRLERATREHHARAGRALISLRPFAGRDAYLRLLGVQLGIHRLIAPLYRDVALGEVLPGLAQRCRHAAVIQDCEDLGLDVERLCRLLPSAAWPSSSAEAMGRLYAVEGSGPGAAFLFRLAGRRGLPGAFGVRHLAPHPAGRGLHWYRFTRRLDAVPLSAEARSQAIRGARDVFAHAEALTRRLSRRRDEGFDVLARYSCEKYNH